MKVELAVSRDVVCVPDTDLDPDHAPLAVHDVAFVEDQVNVELLPDTTEVGEDVKETVGGNVTELLTFTDTRDDVVVLPAASLATAVSVCVPFVAVVEFHVVA